MSEHRKHSKPSHEERSHTRHSRKHGYYKDEDKYCAKSSRTDNFKKESRKQGKQYGTTSNIHHKKTSSDAIEDVPPSKHQQILDLQFDMFKRTLNQLFSHFIEDEEDLWNFVKKYEKARRKKLEELEKDVRAKADSPACSELGVPVEYDTIHNINIDLNIKDSEILARLEYYDSEDCRCNMSLALYKEWKLLLRTYLDFKQKEKFMTLSKIRDTQRSLPVFQFKQEIMDTVLRERVVIIAGDTGCGKSTQIPQYLVEAGFQRIACTQPRRIACISLSKRVAYESLSQHADLVGYQIRFEKHRRQSTKIVFITEGLLLRQVSSDAFLSSYDVLVLDEIHERHLHGDFLLGVVSSDAFLSSYDVLVLDEIHERHLHGDFLLGVVKCLLHASTETKVILMSATINIQLFHQYFDRSAKIIKVPGRLYPIQLEYHPIVDPDRSRSEKLDPSPYIRVLSIIDKKYPRSERGDVLIFMSGISEISAVVSAAQEYNEKCDGWIILPLHSTLSLEEQDKVFHYAPEGMRKCIVSTNIAETSVTIDGIRFVIDSGKVKEMNYDVTSKMSTLQEFWISKASAEQRKGRAGRTGPGVCFRLYAEEQYARLAEYSTPEIRRVSLDSLLLSLACMGLGDVRRFPFLEAPPLENIESSVQSLKQHGALDSQEKVTRLGHFLSDLPVDIPLGKMLVFGTMFHQIDTVLSLAAVLSVQSPFTNRAFRDPECESARKELESDHGDALTVLKAYSEWLAVKRSRVQSRQWCKRRGIEEQRFYEVTKLRTQFKQVLMDSGLMTELPEPDSTMSSRERALRHGELKLLKSAKRKLNEEAPSKRKMLKPDTYEIEREEDREERGERVDKMDANELEFRLRNDSRQIQDLLSVSSARSHSDVTILKVILASGLYPQVAVGDEFNTAESVKEALFHCKDKGFVSLHPFSVFSSTPEVLKLGDLDIMDPPPGIKLPGRSVLSAKHQLLVYMSLLETSKPFLVNSLRMPALHTLLLFSSSVHANADLTRLVFDSWIETILVDQMGAEKTVLAGIRIRDSWQRLLGYQLDKVSTPDVTRLETSLTRDLVLFMSSATHDSLGYSLRRLLAADLKTMYRRVAPESVDGGSNPFMADFPIVPNEEVGGLWVTPYLVYDCLADGGGLVSFLCEGCEFELELTTLEKLQHLLRCAPQQIDLSASSNPDSTPGGVSTPSTSNAYFCDICNESFHLNPISILKHRKSHATS